MIDEELLEHLEENACLLADGYGSNPVAVYDVDLCIKCLVDEGMITEDALDHFYYNTVGSYVGEKTPLFLRIFK